ncbi:MAG: DUF1015 domain-containing protein [Clostridia bacterium]|nr:DUF1015 domain-containing protein [Clostridia bacterium]
MSNYLTPANILLPKKNFSKWSVIACDQYTSEPEYWEETEKIVGNECSALKIILPEVYLTDDNSAKITEINKNMSEYSQNGVFQCFNDTLVLTVRTLKNGKVRTGIVGLIDLEDYSYEKGADTLIRATEATVIERIPPRVQIRKDAVLEIPHVMLLINDPQKTVIEPLFNDKESFDKLYDFDLMQNAGSIKGYKIPDKTVETVNVALDGLKNANGGMLFAVGDGNHSLATAKECYKNHNGSRFALVEVVNIHDSSLEFEPIYRAVFGTEPEKLINEFISFMGGEYEGEGSHKYTCVFGKNEKKISVKAKSHLAVADLQNFLDRYIEINSEVKLDYIHGVENTVKLALRDNTVGFIFEGMSKSDLFPAVACDGSLPRKTFSMGTADDKRFYLEARKLDKE